MNCFRSSFQTLAILSLSSLFSQISSFYYIYLKSKWFLHQLRVKPSRSPLRIIYKQDCFFRFSPIPSSKYHVLQEQNCFVIFPILSCLDASLWWDLCICMKIMLLILLKSTFWVFLLIDLLSRQHIVLIHP